MLALLGALVTGIVPPEQAFTGFGDDIVVIVATALLVSAAVARSGITERLMAPLAPHLSTVRRQVVVLVGVVTVLSAFVKNVGALAILMPIVFQQARRAGTPASAVLMPLAFGSLLGGLMTLIGTSPNVIVSRMRAELLGEPFRMFDFMPVGAGIALAGVIFLAFGYRLLPGGRKGSGGSEAGFRIEDYSTEATLPADSPLAGKTVADLEALADGEVTVTTIIREQFRRYAPAIALGALSRRRADPAGRADGAGAGRRPGQAPAGDQGGRSRGRRRRGDRRRRGGDQRRIRRWSGAPRPSCRCGHATRSTWSRSAAPGRA